MHKRICLIAFFFSLFSINGFAQSQYFGQNKPRYRPFNFKVLQSPHFELYNYFQDRKVADHLLVNSENWYNLHQEVFKLAFIKPNPLIIYKTHPDFQETTAIGGQIGEGSGGVSVPELHATHDGAAAVALILQGLATSGKPVSELVRELPRLTMLKHNVAVEPNRLYSVLQNFRLAMEDEQLTIDVTDGIKIVFPEGWIHVRASNTESMIRIIAEAADPQSAQNLLNRVRDRLGKG